MRLMAQDAVVTLWDNNVMQLPKETIGLNGSATQVRRIFSPERAQGEILGEGIDDPDKVAQLLVGKLVEKDLIFI